MSKKATEQKGNVYQKWSKRRKAMLWYTRIKHEGRTYRAGPFETKSEAKEAITKLRVEVQKGIVKEKITFAECADQFLAASKLENPTTYDEYEKRLKHLRPYFAHFKLDEIKPVHIKQYRQHRLSEPKPPKPATVNRELATLSRIFTIALEDEKITHHPMARRRLKLFEEKRPVRPLLEDERVRLLAACKLDPTLESMEPIIITALHTGMRLMELLTLKWAAVDMEERIITVVKSKSKKPRYIPMTNSVYKALKGIERVDEYVFRIDRTGDFKAKVQYKWNKLCELAGVHNLRFHDLRATCATRLTDRKVSIRVVQALLGHSTPVVTEKYIRVDKSLEDAIATLDEGQKRGHNDEEDPDDDS